MKRTQTVIVAVILMMVWFIPGSLANAQEATSTPNAIIQEIINEIEGQLIQLQARLDELIAQESITQDEFKEIKDTYKFIRTLRQGARGEDVKVLQEFLKENEELYPEGLVTSYFGPLTENAVKRFQKENNIVATGTPATTGYGQAGPRTRTRLNELIAEGAGASGMIPPGLLRAPGLEGQFDFGTTTGTTTPPTDEGGDGAGTTTPPTSDGGEGDSDTSTSIPPTGSGGGGDTGDTGTSTPPTDGGGDTGTTTPPTDTFGPLITALSIIPTSGDPGTIITFSVTAEDPDGVTNVNYDIKYPGSNYTLRPNCNFTQPEYTAGNTCTFSQNIDGGISPTLLGGYVIETVRATDGTNQSIWYPDGTVDNASVSTHSFTIPVIYIGVTPPSADTTNGSGGGVTGQFAYISNIGNDTVSVIDTSTNMIVATIPVGTDPSGVVVSPDNTRVYIANGQPSSSISVIDATNNTVIATIAVGGDPEGIAITPDGSRVYVANSESNTVSVIDTATNSVIATVGVGRDPGGVAVNPSGTQVYVTAASGSVIDVATNTVVGSIPITTGGALVFSPDGGTVYTAQSVEIRVIETVANTLVDTIPTLGAIPDVRDGIEILPDGTRLYTTAFTDGAVIVIDTSDNTILTTIPVGMGPTGLAVTLDGSRFYVANSISDTVSVIDVSTNTVVDTIALPTGSSPRASGKFISTGMSSTDTTTDTTTTDTTTDTTTTDTTTDTTTTDTTTDTTTEPAPTEDTSPGKKGEAPGQKKKGSNAELINSLAAVIEGLQQLLVQLRSQL